MRLFYDAAECRRKLSISIVLVASLGFGCQTSDLSDAASPTLELDVDSSSPTFGSVVLRQLWSDSEPSPGESVDGSSLEGLSSVENGFAVWLARSQNEDPCAGQDPDSSLLGRYRREDRDLVFTPRFPWTVGESYIACAHLDRLVGTTIDDFNGTSAVQTLVFVAPRVGITERADLAAPTVIGVWPDLAVVPENLLRIYLHFSEPMRRDNVSQHVSLISRNGTATPDALVDIPNGLWSADATRLTLFLHPGRIKRGVGPRQRLGPVLKAGQSFRIRVDGALESARGVALGKSFEHEYTVAEADRERPDPDRWALVEPSDKDAPVTLRFDDILDREQLQNFAWITVVEDGTGTGSGTDEMVSGEVLRAADGSAWSFHPSQPWQPQRHYRITTRASIEDLAGNTAERLFDLDTRELPGKDSVVVESFGGSTSNREFFFSLGARSERD